jgi:muramoyltetrapeptide carboxypeptidase LdcA involved in peptidoglycan recycling
MMKMFKPKNLKKGSTIAVISPSWGGPSLFPGIYEKAIKNLKEMFDFNIIEYPTARMTDEKLYQNPQLRAKDINGFLRFGDLFDLSQFTRSYYFSWSIPYGRLGSKPQF